MPGQTYPHRLGFSSLQEPLSVPLNSGLLRLEHLSPCFFTRCLIRWLLQQGLSRCCGHGPYAPLFALTTGKERHGPNRYCSFVRWALKRITACNAALIKRRALRAGECDASLFFKCLGVYPAHTAYQINLLFFWEAGSHMRLPAKADQLRCQKNPP